MGQNRLDIQSDQDYRLRLAGMQMNTRLHNCNPMPFYSSSNAAAMQFNNCNPMPVYSNSNVAAESKDALKEVLNKDTLKEISKDALKEVLSNDTLKELVAPMLQDILFKREAARSSEENDEED